MRKLTFLFALLCASVMGWATQICDFATGHENNADFGDANGRILLSIEPTANANEYKLTIKPNYANGATKKLDYIYAELGNGSTTSPYPITAGSDIVEGGEDEMSATFTYTGTTGSMMIQWSNPDWGGRWQCTLSDVDFSSLEACSGGGGSSAPTPGEKFVAADASIDHSYFANWEWAQEYNSTASYNNTTGEITVHIDNDKNIQWYAQVHLALGFSYVADKYYDFSIKFHADKAVNQVTLKTSDNVAMFYEDQSVNLPADEDFVFTKTDVLGKAGNNIFVFDFGHVSANTNITISEISIIEKDEPSTPAVVEQYCRKATGHLGNAEFGDVNGRILLTLRKLSNSSVKVKVEPNNNGNDYFDIMHVELNGVAQEIGSAGGSALSNMEFEYTGLASLNFTLNLLWHNHNWADLNGRWTTQQFNVTEAELCTENTVLSLGSEYCCYYGDETKTGSRYATLTWETNEDGDIVITIGDGPGENNTRFRGNGLGNDLSGFTVLSGAGFATSEAASTYFNRVYTAGGQTYILQKKGGVALPSPAKIHFSGKPFEWACTEEGNAYTNPTFEYTYGKVCDQWDAPTNVAVDGSNLITFDAVAGATTYIAHVSLSGVEKHTQIVVSGDELTFVPLVDGDYDVNVIARGAGKVDSDPSTAFVWSLTATPIVLGNSEYCEHIMQTGTNTEAAFTWETDGSGNIVITIAETLGGAANASHFRNNALALNNFTVGSGHAAASGYFSHPGTTTGNQLVLTATSAPALGEKIYYNGVVEYATSGNGDAWPTLQFEWTYGTVCSGKAVSATSNNSTMGTAVVQKAGVDVTNVDDGDEVSFIATVADAELYRFVNWTKGGVEVSTNATYVTTITETTNLIANFEYIRNTYCHAEINSIQNKKLYMTLGAIGGGQYQIKIEGSSEAKLTALTNANYTVNHVTTDIVDGDKPMSGQDVPFANARWSFNAAGYGSATMVFGIQDGYTWEDIYVWNHAIYFSSPSGEIGYTGFPGRYHIAWNETCSDAEAPVFAKAQAAVIDGSSVRLTIQASDNWEGMLTYTIARAGAEPIISNHASGEEFTQDVTGLTAGTEYTFTVSVSDGVNVTNQNIVVTPEADSQAPVMGAASLDSKTWNSAIINVAATDNLGVASFYIVELDNNFVASDGKITVTGLTAETAYSFTIKAKDAAGNMSDNSAGPIAFTTDAHLLAPTSAASAPTWPEAQVKGIYSPTYSADCGFDAWGSGTVYTQDTYGKKYEVPASGYFGTIGFSLNCINMEQLHYDIWIADDATLRIVPICRNTADTGNEPEIGVTVNLTGQQWNSIDLSLATDYAAVTNWSNVYQVKIDNAANLTFWVGNAYFYRTTAIVDSEAPTNASASLVATGFYSVEITAQAEDNSGAVNFSIKNGDTQVATGAAASGAATTITVSGLTPGTAYNFNVVALDEAGNEAAPIVVAATTKFMPGPAPAPVTSGKVIVPVFSDALTGCPAEIHSGGWGESTIAQWLDLRANDKVFYAQNFNYAGWHSWGVDIDASEMTLIHVDIYSLGMTQLSFTPISHDPTEEGVYNITLTPNAWTSVDIPLSVYPNVELNKIFQFKFMGAVGGNEFMVDNVYFWHPTVTTNQDKWATFACDANVNIPSGITAYKAVYSNAGGEEVLELEAITGGVIPAKAGVILQSENANTTFEFEKTNAASDFNMSDNSLVGCVVRTDVSAVRATEDIFCMRRSNLEQYNMTGFFLYEGQYVPAGRAYLALPKTTSGTQNAAQRRIRFVINEPQTPTDIDSVSGNLSPVTEKFIENGQLYIRRGDNVYTIQGARVK